jgi:hypothetical protein
MHGPSGWCVQPFFGAVSMKVSENKVKKKKRVHFSPFSELILHSKLVFNGLKHYQKEKWL